MRPTLLFLLLFAPALPAAAQDHLDLRGGDSLSGSISSIGPDGRVTLDYANATTPLELKRSALSKILFSPTTPPKTNYSEIISLSNGDRLPGNISTLDATTVGFETEYASLLAIPRAEALAIDFGVRPQNLVFSGPGKTSDWESNDNWVSAGNTLTNRGSGRIARPDVLPAQFILRFRLEWEGSPSIRFYFCDDLLEEKGEADRYYFEFTNTGMRIMREQTGKDRRATIVANIRRKPSSFTEDQADIELRVDREQGLLYLYLDGNSEGHHRDHLPTFPTGSGIMLQSMAGGDMKNIVSRIEIYDWDAVSQVRSDEGHEDKKQDSLIASNGERFSGMAEELVQRTDGTQGLVFASPHSDESFTIPHHRISTLYFRRSESPTRTHKADCTVFLTNKGQIQVSAIQLDSDHLSGTHPLLGEISIDRETISRVEFLPDPSSAKTDAP